MSNLIVPRHGAHVNGRRPTTEDYVNSMLRTLRARRREATTFTPAGRTVIHKQGERIIYAPNGDPIRVLEMEDGNGNQVEHGDHLHAHIRPTTVTRGATIN